MTAQAVGITIRSCISSYNLHLARVLHILHLYSRTLLLLFPCTPCCFCLRLYVVDQLLPCAI